MLKTLAKKKKLIRHFEKEMKSKQKHHTVGTFLKSNRKKS